MIKYSVFSFLIMIAVIFGQYKYNDMLNQKVDLRDGTIAGQVVLIEDLRTQLANTRAMLAEQSRQLSDNVSEFEAYKKRVQNIKNTIIRVPIYTEIIKTEPAEIVICAPLLLQACVTTKEVIRTVEVPVPVYPLVQPEKPSPPELDELTWNYIEDLKLFVLTPEEFDKYGANLAATNLYISLLQEGWDLYERASSDPNKLGTTELGTN